MVSTNEGSEQKGRQLIDLGYRPLVYMWIAEYRDGTALPQFDPDTGEEIRFANIDQSRLCRFGWYPFSAEMVAKMSVVAISTRNSIHTVELKPGDKLFAVRRNHIEFNLRGGIRRKATLYLLGVEGGKVIEIGEDGKYLVP